MPKVNTYLNFNGNTEEAFNFYKSVFGGEFTMLQRLGEAPENYPIAEKDKQLIMHVALPIGNNLLMGTDVSDNMPQVIFGTNSSIIISADTEEQAKDYFEKLSAGGKVTMALEKMFWGSLFGSLTDKFGVQWMFSFDYNEHGE